MAEWSSGLCECSPCGTCMLGCFCPCILFGRTRHRLNHDRDLNGYSCCNGACMVWNLAACFGFHCIPNLVQRGDIRAKSNPRLSGNGCSDCMKGWCCSCCDLIQQEKQVISMSSHPNHPGPPVMHQPPAHGQQMHYQPPAHAQQQMHHQPPAHHQQQMHHQSPMHPQHPQQMHHQPHPQQMHH